MNPDRSFTFRRSSMAQALRSRRGSISILSAIAALVLVGVVGLGLDTALVLTARQQLQRTSDAAALSGAAKVKLPGQTDYDLTRQATIATALSNPVLKCGTSGITLTDNASNDPSGEIVIGRWRFDRTTRTFGFVPTNFSTGLPVADSVKVNARCASGSLNTALDLLFGPIFGTNDSNVGRSAIARLGKPDDPLILVLEPHRASALLIDGGAYMDVLAGTIQVDSDNACAFRMNGSSGVMEAQRTRVVGDVCLDIATNLTGDLITQAPYVPDPLAGLPELTTAGLTNYGGITATGTYLPGYYPDGIKLNGGTTTLLPGLYYIGRNGSAGGIKLSGDAFLVGDQVMLFLENGASLNTSGAGSGLDLSPPASGTYQGVTIFQARASSQGSDIGGGGIFDVDGTYYIPNGEMWMHGDVTRTVGQIIVNSLRITGNARYVITGNLIRPRPGPDFVFLVN